MPESRFVSLVRRAQDCQRFRRSLLRQRLFTSGPLPRRHRLLRPRFRSANRRVAAKYRQPIIPPERLESLLRGIPQSGTVSERPVRQHALHPFFRAATIKQRAGKLLSRQVIQPRNSCQPVRSLRCASKYPKPRDPAVGINIQPHVRRRAHVVQLPAKSMTAIWLQRHAGQQLSPARLVPPRSFRPSSCRLANLDRTAVRKIPLKMRRVHFHAPNRPRHSQLHDRPIVSRPAPAPRFPPVAHDFAAPRHQHIQRLAVESIARRNPPPAIFNRRQIHLALGDSRRVRHHLTIQTQARHAAIGINPEAHVRITPRVLHHHWIYRIAFQHSLRQNLFPMRRRGRQLFLFVPVRRRSSQIASLQRNPHWIISGEKTRVHDRPAQNSRQAQAHNAPIVSWSPSPPRFPAVHPLSLVGVFALDKNRLRLLQQIFLGREKFVVCLHHAAAQPFRRQIHELRELVHTAPRCSACPTGPAENSPRSNIFRPRKNVVSTRPKSSRPA